MPKFRFETSSSGQTAAIEEELASSAMASPRAIEKARAAIEAKRGAGTEQSGSIKVYDEAGYLVATVNFSDLLDDSDAALNRTSEPPVEEPGVMRSG